MGVSAVAEAAACSGQVALARMRSTPSARNPFMIVVQFVCSPPAFCSRNTTLSAPSSSVRPSIKPCVASLSETCSICSQMPIV